MRWLVAMLDLEWRVLRADPVSLQRFVIAPLLLGLLLGILFFRLPSDPLGEEERIGVCFVILVLFGIDAGLGMKALEGRMMWGEVCAGRLTLAVHALVTAYGELVLRRTAPGILLPLPILLLSALTGSFWRCVSFIVVCVVATWSCSALAIALWLLVTGIREGSRWGRTHATALGTASNAVLLQLRVEVFEEFEGFESRVQGLESRIEILCSQLKVQVAWLSKFRFQTTQPELIA